MGRSIGRSVLPSSCDLSAGRWCELLPDGRLSPQGPGNTGTSMEEAQTMDSPQPDSPITPPSPALTFLLLAYLLVVGLGATLLVALNFPTFDGKTLDFGATCGGSLPVCPGVTTEQRLVLLAFLAGVSGSFLHAAQSLTSYLGNQQFQSSWTSWYVLRPWIGGILGFTIYFAFRAGLVPGSAGVNPFGIVAIGVLGGWFSKTTTDKLQEVFETLFKTDADKQRKDKLKTELPVIDAFDPAVVRATVAVVRIVGKHFPKAATVEIAGQTLTPSSLTETLLVIDVSSLSPRPDGEVDVRVKGPGAVASAPAKLTFT